MYYTYILWSSKRNVHYIGSTDDVQRRIVEHNTGRSGYTKTGIPWTLQYVEEFSSRHEAARREIEIKERKSRKYIERLIRRKNLQLVQSVSS